MCIRDRDKGKRPLMAQAAAAGSDLVFVTSDNPRTEEPMSCLLYTSDAADERSSVDLGGRRIIKKKKEEDKRGGANFRRKTTKEKARR